MTNDSREKHKKDLKDGCFHFRKSLQQYKEASSDDKKRIAVTMRDHLALINASLKELERQGAYKHNVRLEHDLNAYIQTESSEGYAGLEQGLTTLLEFSKLK